MTLRTDANRELKVGAGNKPFWNQPGNRRQGFFNLHHYFRRSRCLRAARTMSLASDPSEALSDAIASLPLVTRKEFSAVVVARDNSVLLERYARDFGPHQPHSIQSITKMHMHIMMGQLIKDGRVEPDRPVKLYLPEIGTGYANAPVQRLLDMNVVNDYSEDYDDPESDVYAHEVSLGWRLPTGEAFEQGLPEYLCGIQGSSAAAPDGVMHYKSANTDVLAMIVDRVSPRGINRQLQAIVEACGYEAGFHISTDRDGMPGISGGGVLTCRDLARFGLLFARRFHGTDGALVGCEAFLRRSVMRRPVHLAPPSDRVAYSNQLFTNGRWIGHSGYGGQMLLVDLESGVSCAYFSVLENESGYDFDYVAETIGGLETLLDCL